MNDTHMLLEPIITMETDVAKDTKEVSVLDRLRKLDEERAQLVESAFDGAMKEATAAIEQLNYLGRGKFRLAEEHETVSRPRATSEGKKRGLAPGTVCPVCDFATEPPHDKRSHRGGKPAFTLEDLAERELRRID